MASNIKWQNSLRCWDSPNKCSRRRSFYSKSETDCRTAPHQRRKSPISQNVESAKNARNGAQCSVINASEPHPGQHPASCRQNEGKHKGHLNVHFKPNTIRDPAVVMEPNTVSSVICRSYLSCSCLEEQEEEQKDAVHEFALYLKAFALIYVLPEEEWNVDNVDKLLLQGADLFQGNADQDAADGPGQICSAHSGVGRQMKHSFQLDGHDFTLELRPPYLGDNNRPADCRPLHIMKNLKTMLGSFFRTAHYCLLRHKEGCLLIWRRRHLFYAMDVKRQRRDPLVRARSFVQMLMRLPALDNLVQLIHSLSGNRGNDAFTIRELAVVRLVTPDGRVFLRDAAPHSVSYNVMSDSYAYLKSNLHLSLNPSARLRNCSSVIVGIAGILASNIDHPAAWNTSMFDRLICYGVELCRSCWGKNPQARMPIDLEKFPTQLRLGQFVSEIELLPKVCYGRWSSDLRCQGNDFEFEIRQVLRDFGNALFQINNQMYALWCKDNFYYLLDPYRHIVVSKHSDPDAISCDKWATVRMCRDLPTMLNVFHQLLSESNRRSTFLIHVVRIKNIAECPKGYALRPRPKNAYCTVKPLNLPIEFPPQLGKCEKLLAEVSDYEPNMQSLTEDTDGLENTQPTDAKHHVDDVQVEIVRPSNRKQENYSRCVQIEMRNRSKSLGTENNAKLSLPLSFHSKTKDQKTTDKLSNLRTKAGSDHAVRTHPKTSPETPARNKHVASLAKPVERRAVARKEFRAFSIATNNRRETRLINGMHSKLEAPFYAPIRQRQLKPNSKCAKSTESRKKLVETVAAQSEHGSVSSEEDSALPMLAYPVFTVQPCKLAVVGSESGTMESLNRLLDSAFKVTNRALTITPWGNYMVFKQPDRDPSSPNPNRFYVYDGCTCNIDRFRHLDLSGGTAGLLSFQNQSDVVCYMIDARETKALEMLTTNRSSRQFEKFLSRGT